MELCKPEIATTILTQLNTLAPIESSKQAVCNLAMQGIDEVDMDALVQAIEQCPSLTAKIVGLANSAFYGVGATIASVEQAIIRVLGLKMVKSMVVGMTLAETFDASECSLFDEHQYWQVALQTAALNRALCKLNSHEMNPDIGYLSGLLFSIGELALAQVIPAEYRQILSTVEDPDQKYSVELQGLGMHSGQVGELLAKKWSLPTEIQVVMSQHMNPEYEGDFYKYALLTGISCRWVTHYIGAVEQDYAAEVENLQRLTIEEPEFELAVGTCFDQSEEAAQLAQEFAARA